MGGVERRIPAAECTEYPWWAIIDPDVIHGLFDKQQRIGRVAAAITGPFMSRAEAEAQLSRRRYAYGPNTAVYSLSGHDSKDWRSLCREPSAEAALAAASAEGEAAGYRRAIDDACALLDEEQLRAWATSVSPRNDGFANGVRHAMFEVRALAPVEPVSKADELPAKGGE